MACAVRCSSVPKALIINGKPADFADASKFYKVSTVNYLAAGSCNFNDDGVSLWPLNKILNDTQYYVRDAVIDYITAKGTVSPAIEGRLVFQHVAGVGQTGAQTALGATKVGPFSNTTKVAARGKYETWRFKGGPAMAGKTVQIWVATKKANGTWGAFSKLTSRVADASGNAYFWLRSSTSKWVSVRAFYVGDATHSASWSVARQARWL